MERTKDLLGRIELQGGASGCQRSMFDAGQFKTMPAKLADEAARLDVPKQLILWERPSAVIEPEPAEQFETIYSYSRAQAIEDGVLVDLMQADTVSAVREAGFKFPIAMTSTAFAETIAPIDGGELPAGQDLQGRLWDVLTILKHAIKTGQGDMSLLHFSLLVAQHNNTRKMIALKAVCDGGDTGEPVITIMLPYED
jgi:hypothetical protein